MESHLFFAPIGIGCGWMDGWLGRMDVLKLILGTDVSLRTLSEHGVMVASRGRDRWAVWVLGMACEVRVKHVLRTLVALPYYFPYGHALHFEIAV